MTRSLTDLETLNAYVDGELSPRESAAVAKALVDDAELAEKVAVIHRVKAAIQESREDASIELPEAPRPARRRALIAAAVAVLLLLTAAALWFRPGGQTQVAWLDRAWEHHRSWAAESVAAAEPSAGLLLAAINRLGSGALVPDLAAARLRLSKVALLEGPEGRSVLQVGYSGTRGCRISLFLLPLEAALGRRPIEFGDAKSKAYAWRVGAITYLLLAEGMDMERFALISRKVNEASLERAPFDAETRTALGESRAKSKPCLA